MHSSTGLLRYSKEFPIKTEWQILKTGIGISSYWVLHSLTTLSRRCTEFQTQPYPVYTSLFMGRQPVNIKPKDISTYWKRSEFYSALGSNFICLITQPAFCVRSFSFICFTVYFYDMCLLIVFNITILLFLNYYISNHHSLIVNQVALIFFFQMCGTEACQVLINKTAFAIQ